MVQESCTRWEREISTLVIRCPGCCLVSDRQIPGDTPLNGETIRRNLSLDRATDIEIRRVVDESKLPLSVMLRILFGTPAAANETVNQVRDRFRQRLDVEKARRMRKND